ncbi:flagellar filament capping protein FliD [Planctomicrobium sp. SH664]|uniref:flagellar filament capping protein FliD n=1 Tax=Planctomicrobium sp. SH664 TaxID=3448125 RepID=UPI003F5C6D5C
MAINISGLISGIDTDNIISGLLDVQQKQIDQFNSRKQNVQLKQAAFQTLEAQLVSLRTTIGQLSRTQNSVFDSRTVSVSDSNAVLATAASRAVTGSYQLKIESLAKAHQVASQGFNDADAAITQGTFTVRIGGRPAADITIDGTNNTLAGLANAINFANVGVSASVVQDGSTGGNAYRLLLTSTETGQGKSISVVNSLTASDGETARPEFDFDYPVQAATDAQIRLGDGPGALVVNKSTNTVSDLISGVTLNLLAADAGKTVTVNVAQDTSGAATAVQDFVSAYNGVLDLISKYTSFDAETKQAGILLGDRSISQIKNELQSTIQSVVPGLSAKANRLSSLGITVADNGSLVVDSGRLESVIAGKVSGVTSGDLRKLFALDGTSDSGNVSFLLGSARTKSSSTPYRVQITQAAERATIAGANPLAPSTTIDATNETLRLNLDGTDLTVTLARGTYAPADLARQLQTVVNQHPDLTGRALTAAIGTGGELTLTSDSYGSSSRVTVVDGSALGILGLTGGEADTGVDVAGYFLVNGQQENATGRGRILSGDADNANTADLQVRVTLSPAQVASGATSEIRISRGLASMLDQVLVDMSSSKGTFQAIGSTLTSQLESIQKSLDRQQATFDRQKDDITRQFTALESAIASMQNTSSLLGAQLAGLSSIGK